MAAYDRLAAAKFREHKCEVHAGDSAPKEPTRPAADTPVAERARIAYQARIQTESRRGPCTS
jgi:hypothetical protein